MGLLGIIPVIGNARITTLNKIREHLPCTEGWANLLKHLNKTKADDAPVSLLTILDSNGLDDALWCMRAVDGCDREVRLFAVWCARQVEGLTDDSRVPACNDVTERFANGLVTRAELAVARDAAEAAAWDAANATTNAAAWDAAKAAAEAAQERELRRILTA